ncbi:MAG: prepilin peptidase [Acidobacteriaceae bacterium]
MFAALAILMSGWGYPLALFGLGLVFGSFLNVCIYRLPLGRSVVAPGSACPECGKAIRAYDNIPVLSWLALRGRCRDCGAGIAARYPAVELMTGLLFLACALHFSSSSSGAWAAAKYCVLCFLLLGLIFTDLEHLTLPDEMTWSGIALGLLFSSVVWVPGVPGWLLLPQERWEVRVVSLLHAVIGAAVGAGVVYVIGEIYRRARGAEGIGLGDVKLMGMIGAFLGMRLALFTLFLGSAIGAAVGIAMMVTVFLRRQRRYRSNGRAWRSVRAAGAHFPVPFGSFLGIAGLVAVFWGERVLGWYWGAVSGF